MNPLLGTLLIVSLLVAGAWLALAIRALGLILSYRPLRPDHEPIPEDAPAIDAIVPARNEQDHVEATVNSLRAQEYPRLTVTVVNDRSTDRTGAILDHLAVPNETTAGSVPLRVIHGVERPEGEGWAGKTWALQQGVATIQADWLWFVDADMRLHPRALATAWRLATQTGADLVSFVPSAECRTFWQGAIAMTLTQLLAHLYPIAHVNNPDRPEAMAVGGFMLVRREAYERAGGHEAVRGQIVEDVQLARRIKASGGRLALIAAPDLVETHMYGSFGAIWRGLRKNAYAGIDYKPHTYATGAIVALTMAWAPVLALGVGLFGIFGGGFLVLGWVLAVVGLIGWSNQALAALPFWIYLKLPWPFAFSLPAGITAYVAIATASVWHYYRGRVLWKDVSFSPRDLRSADRRDPGRAGDVPAEVPGATESRAAESSSRGSVR